MSNCIVDVNCLESENDSEMSEIFSRKPVELLNVPEKPLSPVLSRRGVNRRNLFNKKAKHKKSRVNLSQRFQNDFPAREDTTQLEVKEFDDDSLTVSQTDGLIDRIEKLEEIECNRQKFHKFVTRNKPDDFCFKKPVLTPGKHKKIKINGQSSKVCDINVEDEFQEDKIDFKYLTDYKCVLSQTPSFQTATGKNIDISENQIKSYSLLFNDILHSSQTGDITRCNKYSFLSKNKPPENFAQPNNKRSSSSSAKQPEQRTKDLGNRNTFGKQELLLSQEISDTQMLNVASTILDKNESVCSSKSKFSDFTGFTHEEIIRSKVLLHDLYMVCKNIDKLQDTSIENQYFSKKRKLDNENSPQRKRLKKEHDSKHVYSSVSSNKLLDFPSKIFADTDSNKDQFISKVNTCKLDEILINKEFNVSGNSLKAGLAMGFSKASGKSIDLTDDSINKAKKMFSNMENVTIDTTAESLNRVDCRTKLELLNEAIKCLERKKQASGCKNRINKSHGSKRSYLSAGFSKASGKSVNLSAEDESSKSLLDQNQDDIRSRTLVNSSREGSVLGKPKFVRSSANGLETITENFINSINSVSGNPKQEECETKDCTNSAINQRQGQKRNFTQVSNFNLDLPGSMQQESSESITRITSRNKLALLDKAIKDVETSKDNHSNQLVQTFGEISDIKSGTPVKNNAIRGFSKASGVAIDLTETSLQRAKSLFSDIENESSERITRVTSGNKLKLLDEARKHAEMGINSSNYVSSRQEQKCYESNKMKCVIEKQESSESRIFFRNKLKLMDEGIKNDEIDINSANCSSNYQERKFCERGNIKCDTSTNNKNLVGFTRASGVPVHLSEISMQQAKGLFSDIEKQEQPERITRITSRNKLKLLDDAIKEAEKNMDITEIDSPRPLLLSNFKPKPMGLCPNVNKSMDRQARDIHSSSDPAYSTPIKANQNRTFAKSTKKKLGISSYQVIPISESKLHKAKLLFGEDIPEPSPIKPCYTSTPFKPTMLMGSFSGTIDTTTLYLDSNNDNIVLGADSDFVIVPPTKGNTEVRVKEFGEECERLQARIQVVTERQKVLQSTKTERTDSEKKPRVGALYNQKRNSIRKPLGILISEQHIEDNDFLYVNPRNAEHFHFKETSPIVTTADGATVIPSIKDLIGLSEIEHGFHTMPGVDPRLLQKDWLRNHYKWVVWKLASYERMYPNDLKGCLSVDNVIQQLKYRYDREIDKAERPALRRILEKDDAPQKRMVLCVSDIKTSEHELELTDGWYPVRTVVDELLYRQVTSGRIRVGTKLVIAGAELLNCDGCHPLEVTDLTCLKINYNCTRRAIWHAKLGYQPFPGPFPIRITTVHPLGGAIGAIRICIVRIYPLKYLERMGTNTVWRNQKAEERRAQDWENEQSKRMEKIEEGIRKEFSKSIECPDQVSRLKNITSHQLSSISSPKLLFEIIETSNDPDNILENLTASQRSALMDYRRSQHSKKQQQINIRIKENVEKLKLVKRDVSSVLRLLVVDTFGESARHHNFFIWHPNESHGHLLREKTLLTVYNVLARKNGDLNSTSKTIFKPTSGNFVINECYKRQVIDIEILPITIFPQSFKDFDTVGIVVETTVETNKQEVWLTGFSGRLLLIEVIEGPSQCLLLDNLRRGNTTTASNLLYCGFKDDIVYAMANHYTIFSSYSQYKHLQEGLETFKTKIPKDLNMLLDDCDNRIDLYRSNPSTTATFKSFARLDDSDEDTLVQSRLTSTDVALSLIDIDNFV